MNDVKELTERLKQFYKERQWDQFHKPKEVAISVALEAAELLEKFQWERGAELDNINNHKEEISEELADVFIYLLTLAQVLNIDMEQAIKRKIAKNCTKYPVEKIKGKDIKHTEL